MEIQFAVPCLLGLEAPIAQELRELGAADVVSENGRVLFRGTERTLARANIRSRFSERILIVLGAFEAHTFEELFQGTNALPWEDWIGKNDKFPVKGYSLNSDLFSVRDCQSIIKKAVVERLKPVYHVDYFEETHSLYQIQFSIMKNRVSLMIDTSGRGLHKRGYRPQANEAPIKETLAAALCYFSKLRPYHTLYDPLCGSGTILIEGAMMAANIAPGVNRHFISERWEQVPRAIWHEERDAARALENREIDFVGYGSDIDRSALELAQINAKQAGVSQFLHFERKDVRDFLPRTDRGTIITNPPYGERLSDTESVRKLYQAMGHVMPRKHGFSYSVITSDEAFETDFGRKADKRRKLYNGMLKCQLFMFYK